METKYSYQDVAIMPSVISEIEHRSECILPSPLPIFTAPMTTVVGKECVEEYEKNDIIPILPRPESIADRLGNKEGWSAFSLGEFEAHYVVSSSLPACHRVLIDIANGHMKYLYELVRRAKDKWGESLTIMVGNIANPETYLIADAAGADYIRVGIGAGRGCFIAGTLITMYDGSSKPIENVVIGDKVITHTGDVGEVTNTVLLGNEDELITINDIVTCTKDHKFLVVNSSDIDKITEENLIDLAYWVSADQLDESKHILVEFDNETSM